MREIDEVRVEGNMLIIFDTRGERHRFKMGVPEQVYEEIVNKLTPEHLIVLDRRVWLPLIEIGNLPTQGGTA